MSTRFYKFGPFRVDTLNHVLLRDGETLPLKPKVFDTLLVLIESRGRVLDKDELISRLWPDTIVEEANLTQNIYLLRKALGEDPQGETYIETMPKRGYRFVASVCALEAESPNPVLEEHKQAQVIVEEEREQSSSAKTVSGFWARTIPSQRIVMVAMAAMVLGTVTIYFLISK